MMKIFLKHLCVLVMAASAGACGRDLDYEAAESVNAVVPGSYAMVDFSRELRCEFSKEDSYRFYSSSDYGAKGVYAQLDKADIPLIVFLGVSDKGDVSISFFSFKAVKKDDYEKIKTLLAKHFSVVMPSYERLSKAPAPSTEAIAVFKETGANARRSYEVQSCE